MNDKELLELAAKAAGIEIHGWYGEDDTPYLWADIGPDDVIQWNPLTCDSDALRLAVKAHIDVCESVAWYYGADNDPDYAADPYAATRRAIVRAAAEIGKSK